MILSDNLRRYAILTMIIGGTVLALSGLCTGIFIANGQDGYVPNAAGVIAIGSIGIIPSAILFFSAHHIHKNGPKILPAVLILVITIPLAAWMVLAIATLVIRAFSVNFGRPFGGILFLSIATMLTIAMAIFGIKTIRAARNGPLAADEFT